jgi:hypothetical protein
MYRAQWQTQASEIFNREFDDSETILLRSCSSSGANILAMASRPDLAHLSPPLPYW